LDDATYFCSIHDTNSTRAHQSINRSITQSFDQQEGFTWQVVMAIGSAMQLMVEGVRELPSLLREPRPRPAAAFVVLWTLGALNWIAYAW